MQIVSNLVNTGTLLPHGFCINWTPGLLWLYVISDALIVLAYYSIPFTLIYFVSHRKDLAFSKIFIMFGAFILACGTTHLLGIITLWHPIYWIDAGMKAFTAMISCITAITLIVLMPKALKLPSPQQLDEEVERRLNTYDILEKTQAALVESSLVLEGRIKERTNELIFQNEEKEKRAAELVIINKQLKSSLMKTVEVAMKLSEMRDPYTAGHERRVAEIAVAISAELGFDTERQQGMRVAGYLHDIGKIIIPAEILAKPGKLNDIEYSLVKYHVQAGYDAIKDVDFPWPVAEVVFQHHERLDGTGYPRGLKGEEIIIEARILSVADVVESMTSHRPYRAELGIEKALAEIERGSGITYDATVVDACIKLFRENGFKTTQ
jgi:putative nucleotidyltransferase with HDIG domain